MEGELEGELEHEHEAPLSYNEALSEMMASVASETESEHEAEAMAGASTVITVPARDRAALLRLIPQLVRGSTILTRLLRRRRITKPMVRAVPSIVRRTARTLARRVKSGRRVTPRTVGRVMGAVTKRVLSRPNACSAALQRNVRGTRAVTRTRTRTRNRRIVRG